MAAYKAIWSGRGAAVYGHELSFDATLHAA
jgi:hypothetical protein